MKVRATEITSHNIRKFGSAVTTPEGDPTSQAADYKFWSDLAHYAVAGETEIGLCTVYAQPAPEISGVEQHRSTPEILIPIDAPFVVPLLADGEPESELQAFRVNVGEAAVIDPGVWHGACLPVGTKQCTYFVIFRRNTAHDDVAKKSITPVLIEI